MQPLGIALEDGMAGLWRMIGGDGAGKKTSGGAWAWTARVLGYIWVGAWLVWVSPTVFYPYVRLGDGGAHGDHRMLPFTILDSQGPMGGGSGAVGKSM